jgi:sec-independent protein translocase protein TatA
VGLENPLHLAFVAVVALLVLGPRRLPDLARSLGRGVREFREAINHGAAGEPPAHRPPVEHPDGRQLPSPDAEGHQPPAVD